MQTEVIHALTDGAEGEVAPALTAQNFAEAEQLDGRGLHIEIRYLREAPLAGAGVWQATWYPQAPLSGSFRVTTALGAVYALAVMAPSSSGRFV